MPSIRRSSRKRESRQWLGVRDWVSPGGKRLSGNQILDDQCDQQFGHDIHLEQLAITCGHVAEMQYRFEVLELHFDLPTQPVELQYLAGRVLVRQVGEHEKVACCFESTRIG